MRLSANNNHRAVSWLLKLTVCKQKRLTCQSKQKLSLVTVLTQSRTYRQLSERRPQTWWQRRSCREQREQTAFPADLHWSLSTQRSADNNSWHKCKMQKNANWGYFTVRSKPISYTAFSLIQCKKQLNRSSPNTPFCTPISWSWQDWGGNVSKTTCPRLLPSRIVAGPGYEPQTSQP